MASRLLIYSKSGSVIAKVNKWEFQDTYMGEQYITFDISSPVQIPWAVGCYCHYRGETYSLNYIPSTTQSARRGEYGEAFKYDSVKFESAREELTRIVMLDITASTGDYLDTDGTNYTGSSQFSLYCGETIVGTQTRTAVCVLAGKIYANLIRLNTGWHIYIDLTSTHKVNGVDVLNTHTDDKTLTFDNSTVQAALEMVQSEFDLDYCIKGRDIYIGYSLDRLTDDGTDNHDFFYFGYGIGMASKENQGKSLYQIKKTSDSSQKLVTRLRALGSTKNIPYRYYNKKYDLSQALFPTNLQLPGTFLPLGDPSDAAGSTTKWAKNNGRKDSEGKSYCNAVLGATNDSYIDKNNDAASTDEGIREDSARWDGSNSDLEEIYPTIKEMTYGELRKAGVTDMVNKTPTGETDMTAYVNYENTERVDEILSFDGRTNYGDGLLVENETEQQTKQAFVLSSEIQANRTATGPNVWNASTKCLKSAVELFSIENVPSGYYELTPATGNVAYECCISAGRLADSEAIIMQTGLRVFVTDDSGNSLFIDDDGNSVAYYNGTAKEISSKENGWVSTLVDALPDAKESSDAQVSHISVKTAGTVHVLVAPYFNTLTKNGSTITVPTEEITLTWRIGLTNEQREAASESVVSQYWWGTEDSATTYMNTPFYLYIKDFGVQSMQACFNTSDEPVISMTSGYCTGREFKIVSEVPEKVVVDGKNCWKVECSRAEDDTLKTYYPSERDPITIADHFVLLNVSMPDSYVEAAEERLLVAATEYLADNCETNFTYEPSLDDIYLQREYDKYEALGTPEKSIYYKLYAGLKFPFYGIPNEDQEASDVLASITIQKVTIKEGDGDTPKVELSLNDDVQQSTIQKLTTAVDRIYNGSLFSSSGSSVDVALIRNQISQYGKQLFLSKTDEDTAAGTIKFNNGIIADGNSDIIGNLDFGTYSKSLSGGRIDKNADAELKSLVLRESLTVPKLVYNRTEVQAGNTWRCAGGGEIETVTQNGPYTGIATLHLEDGEYGMIAVGDICQGVYHLLAGNYDGSEGEIVDSKNGDFKFAGFKTIYFEIIGVAGEYNESFQFRLRCATDASWTDATFPQPHMNFAAYGNRSNANRQFSALDTTTYHLLLAGVTTWNYTSTNIQYIEGKLDGFNIDCEYWDATKQEMIEGTKALSGYGIAFGNAYMWGNIEQFNRQPSLVSQQIHYLATTLSSGVTVDTEGWTTTVQKVSKDKPYLWQYYTQTFSDDTTKDTDPFLAGNYASDGTSVSIYGSYDTVDDLEAAYDAGELTIGKGIGYITNDDGHLWVFTTDTYSSFEEDMTDVGQIKGDKGDDGSSPINITVSTTSITAKKATSNQFFYIDIKVYRGNTALNYSNGEYVCSTLSDTQWVIDDVLLWGFSILDSGTTFRYRLRLSADTLANISMPFTITIGTQVYSYNILFSTTEDGVDGDNAITYEVRFNSDSVVIGKDGVSCTPTDITYQVIQHDGATETDILDDRQDYVAVFMRNAEGAYKWDLDECGSLNTVILANGEGDGIWDISDVVIALFKEKISDLSSAAASQTFEAFCAVGTLLASNRLNYLYNGSNGAVVRPCGTWVSGTKYVHNEQYIDIVISPADDNFYELQEGLEITSTTDPSKDSRWIAADKFDFVATDLLMSDTIYAKVLQAVNAKIDELVVKRLQTIATGGASISIEGGLMSVFKQGNTYPNIQFGVDGQYAVLNYYDNNGNLLYNLGPDGLFLTMETQTYGGIGYEFASVKMYYLGNNDSPIGYTVSESLTEYYEYHCGWKKVGNTQMWYNPATGEYDLSSPNEYHNVVFTSKSVTGSKISNGWSQVSSIIESPSSSGGVVNRVELGYYSAGKKVKGSNYALNDDNEIVSVYPVPLTD